MVGVSERRACNALGVSRSLIRYRPTRPHADQKLVDRLHDMSRNSPRVGYRKVTVKLRKEGWRVNKKRVARLWRLHGLGVPPKATRRRLGPQIDGTERFRADAPHDVWAVDFLFDATTDGGVLKILTVTDEYTKTCLFMTAARNFKAVDVIDALERLMILYGPPNHLRSDNGPEFVAQAIQRSASKRT